MDSRTGPQAMNSIPMDAGAQNSIALSADLTLNVGFVQRWSRIELVSSSEISGNGDLHLILI